MKTVLVMKGAVFIIIIVNNKHEEWYVCALSRRTRSPLTLAFSSHRVRVCGRIGGFEVPRVTEDTASDVPCVAFSFVKRHLS